MSRRIVIVGAGAAGVFTAYRLRRLLGDDAELVLLERARHIGGNASDIRVGDTTIECGAQFFHRGAQSSFMALLPAAAKDELLALEHYVPMPTADFVGTRDRLLARWQGVRGVWLAGGWTRWFDSQEAALCSADGVAEGILVTRVDAAAGEDRRGAVQAVLDRTAACAPALAVRRLTHALDEVEARG